MVSRKEKIPPEEYSSCPRTDAEDMSQEKRSLKVKLEELHSSFLSDTKPGNFYSSFLHHVVKELGGSPSNTLAVWNMSLSSVDGHYFEAVSPWAVWSDKVYQRRSSPLSHLQPFQVRFCVAQAAPMGTVVISTVLVQLV